MINKRLPVAVWFWGPGVLLVAALAYYFASGGPLTYDRPNYALLASLPTPLGIASPCRFADDCLEPSAELRAAYSDPNVCQETSSEGLRICIAPLGDVDPALVAYLTDYYASQYGLVLHVLPPIAIPQIPVADEPQHSGEWLLDLARNAYSVEAADASVRLIALTSVDIWLESRQRWLWAFGMLSTGGAGEPRFPQAILSTYRMDDRSWGPSYDMEVFRTRVRTMMNKYVAVSYFGLPFSPDPASATYNNILSVYDLDGMAEHIPVR